MNAIGLIDPKQAPVWIQIDPQRVEQAEKFCAAARNRRRDVNDREGRKL